MARRERDGEAFDERILLASMPRRISRYRGGDDHGVWERTMDLDEARLADELNILCCIL